jgi:hypothetical protein
MTPDERIECAAKILAPYILKTIKEMRKQGELGRDEPQVIPTASMPKRSSTRPVRGGSSPWLSRGCLIEYYFDHYQGSL